MSAIHVTSEIRPLKEVFVHRPGEELLNLMPQMLSELLFDDIPYLKQAQKEHDAFCEVFRSQGVRVRYLVDLVAEALEAHPEQEEAFLRRFIQDGDVHIPYYQEALLDYFRQFTDKRDLVRATMRGVSVSEIDARSGRQRSLADFVGMRSVFLLDPLPNLYFTRDFLTNIGTGTLIPRMFSLTRSRETIYPELILRYHPDFQGQVEEYYKRNSEFSIEGGDVLVLREDLIAVGISQRTCPEAIEELANTLFHRSRSRIQKVLAMFIPHHRAYMHLDTVFTQIDTDAFTYHPGIMDTFRCFLLEKDGDRTKITEFEDSLEAILQRMLDLDRVRLFPCGGGDLVAAEREQWNDGSNTLAIAPGKIITYDRNEVTNQLLKDAGFTVLEIPSYELSKGRGGPRCMSMPLVRE